MTTSTLMVPILPLQPCPLRVALPRASEQRRPITYPSWRHPGIVPFPKENKPNGLCDALIETIDTLPRLMRKSLTGVKSTEMARHAALTEATKLAMYFAPHSPYKRSTNENTTT